jgi:hypothetical protein
MSDRFAIVVEGISDPSLVTDIEKTIRESFKEMSLPGSWRVMASPSPISGRWDFSLHGLDVRHTLSIAVPPKRLSGLIPHRLAESLGHLCSARKIDRPGDSISRAQETESTGHQYIEQPANPGA